MSKSYLNISILGVALLFMVIFLAYSELEKSHEIVSYVSRPDIAQRYALKSARDDFQKNRVGFIWVFEIDGVLTVYGLDEKQVSKIAKVFVQDRYWSLRCCSVLGEYKYPDDIITGDEPSEFGLIVGAYIRNPYFVTLYNREMARLLGVEF
ncbi:hypothetical protein ACJJIF_04030 [Microbulbifer sp. SSSA002]|uniref:hypothetical protein n=1 Tax=unclassified Microbulbifer TaxID=2619833 RepID=UPI0040392EDA